jgi:hypothetical protein
MLVLTGVIQYPPLPSNFRHIVNLPIGSPVNISSNPTTSDTQYPSHETQKGRRVHNGEQHNFDHYDVRTVDFHDQHVKRITLLQLYDKLI